MKRMTVIMDSMTEAELDSDGKVFQTTPSRVYRLARGSGATVRDVEAMMAQFGSDGLDGRLHLVRERFLALGRRRARGARRPSMRPNSWMPRV